MSNLFEDHITAYASLLTGAGLTVYRSTLPSAAPAQYVLVHSYFETPDGTIAPDAISLTLAQGPLDPRMYTHCVGLTEQSALATAARVRAAVLNQVPTVSGRTCFPVRWREGRPVQPDEDIPGRTVFDLTDVYGWRSIPA